MYAIRFETKTDKIVAKWKKSNPILFKKLRNILKDIMQHPRTGIGHPEPLVGGGDIIYSRHISAQPPKKVCEPVAAPRNHIEE